MLSAAGDIGATSQFPPVSIAHKWITTLTNQFDEGTIHLSLRQIENCVSLTGIGSPNVFCEVLYGSFKATTKIVSHYNPRFDLNFEIPVKSWIQAPPDIELVVYHRGKFGAPAVIGRAHAHVKTLKDGARVVREIDLFDVPPNASKTKTGPTIVQIALGYVSRGVGDFQSNETAVYLPTSAAHTPARKAAASVIAPPPPASFSLEGDDFDSDKDNLDGQRTREESILSSTAEAHASQALSPQSITCYVHALACVLRPLDAADMDPLVLRALVQQCSRVLRNAFGLPKDEVESLRERALELNRDPGAVLKARLELAKQGKHSVFLAGKAGSNVFDSWAKQEQVLIDKLTDTAKKFESNIIIELRQIFVTNTHLKTQTSSGQCCLKVFAKDTLVFTSVTFAAENEIDLGDVVTIPMPPLDSPLPVIKVEVSVYDSVFLQDVLIGTVVHKLQKSRDEGHTHLEGLYPLGKPEDVNPDMGLHGNLHLRVTFRRLEDHEAIAREGVLTGEQYTAMHKELVMTLIHGPSNANDSKPGSGRPLLLRANSMAADPISQSAFMHPSTIWILHQFATRFGLFRIEAALTAADIIIQGHRSLKTQGLYYNLLEQLMKTLMVMVEKGKEAPFMSEDHKTRYKECMVKADQLLVTTIVNFKKVFSPQQASDVLVHVMSALRVIRGWNQVHVADEVAALIEKHIESKFESSFLQCFPPNDLNATPSSTTTTTTQEPASVEEIKHQLLKVTTWIVNEIITDQVVFGVFPPSVGYEKTALQTYSKIYNSFLKRATALIVSGSSPAWSSVGMNLLQKAQLVSYMTTYAVQGIANQEQGLIRNLNVVAMNILSTEGSKNGNSNGLDSISPTAIRKYGGPDVLAMKPKVVSERIGEPLAGERGRGTIRQWLKTANSQSWFNVLYMTICYDTAKQPAENFSLAHMPLSRGLEHLLDEIMQQLMQLTYLTNVEVDDCCADAVCKILFEMANVVTEKLGGAVARDVLSDSPDHPVPLLLIQNESALELAQAWKGAIMHAAAVSFVVSEINGQQMVLRKLVRAQRSVNERVSAEWQAAIGLQQARTADWTSVLVKLRECGSRVQTSSQTQMFQSTHHAVEHRSAEEPTTTANNNSNNQTSNTTAEVKPAASTLSNSTTRSQIAEVLATTRKHVAASVLSQTRPVAGSLAVAVPSNANGAKNRKGSIFTKPLLLLPSSTFHAPASASKSTYHCVRVMVDKVTGLPPNWRRIWIQFPPVDEEVGGNVDENDDDSSRTRGRSRSAVGKVPKHFTTTTHGVQTFELEIQDCVAICNNSIILKCATDAKHSTMFKVRALMGTTRPTKKFAKLWILFSDIHKRVCDEMKKKQNGNGENDGWEEGAEVSWSEDMKCDVASAVIHITATVLADQKPHEPNLAPRSTMPATFGSASQKAMLDDDSSTQGNAVQLLVTGADDNGQQQESQPQPQLQHEAEQVQQQGHEAPQLHLQEVTPQVQRQPSQEHEAISITVDQGHDTTPQVHNVSLSVVPTLTEPETPSTPTPTPTPTPASYKPQYKARSALSEQISVEVLSRMVRQLQRVEMNALGIVAEAIYSPVLALLKSNLTSITSDPNNVKPNTSAPWQTFTKHLLAISRYIPCSGLVNVSIAVWTAIMNQIAGLIIGHVILNNNINNETGLTLEQCAFVEEVVHDVEDHMNSTDKETTNNADDETKYWQCERDKVLEMTWLVRHLVMLRQLSEDFLVELLKQVVLNPRQQQQQHQEENQAHSSTQVSQALPLSTLQTVSTSTIVHAYTALLIANVASESRVQPLLTPEDEKRARLIVRLHELNISLLYSEIDDLMSGPGNTVSEILTNLECVSAHGAKCEVVVIGGLGVAVSRAFGPPSDPVLFADVITVTCSPIANKGVDRFEVWAKAPWFASSQKHVDIYLESAMSKLLSALVRSRGLQLSTPSTNEAELSMLDIGVKPRVFACVDWRGNSATLEVTNVAKHEVLVHILFGETTPTDQNNRTSTASSSATTTTSKSQTLFWLAKSISKPDPTEPCLIPMQLENLNPTQHKPSMRSKVIRVFARSFDHFISEFPFPLPIEHISVVSQPPPTSTSLSEFKCGLLCGARIVFGSVLLTPSYILFTSTLPPLQEHVWLEHVVVVSQFQNETWGVHVTALGVLSPQGSRLVQLCSLSDCLKFQTNLREFWNVQNEKRIDSLLKQ